MKKTLESIDGSGIAPGAQVSQPPRSGGVRRLQRRVALPTVFLPAIGFVAALVLLYQSGQNTEYLDPLFLSW